MRPLRHCGLQPPDVVRHLPHCRLFPLIDAAVRPDRSRPIRPLSRPSRPDTSDPSRLDTSDPSRLRAGPPAVRLVSSRAPRLDPSESEPGVAVRTIRAAPAGRALAARGAIAARGGGSSRVVFGGSRSESRVGPGARRRARRAARVGRNLSAAGASPRASDVAGAARASRRMRAGARVRACVRYVPCAADESPKGGRAGQYFRSCEATVNASDLVAACRVLEVAVNAPFYILGPQCKPRPTAPSSSPRIGRRRYQPRVHYRFNSNLSCGPFLRGLTGSATSESARAPVVPSRRGPFSSFPTPTWRLTVDRAPPRSLCRRRCPRRAAGSSRLPALSGSCPTAG